MNMWNNLILEGFTMPIQEHSDMEKFDQVIIWNGFTINDFDKYVHSKYGEYAYWFCASMLMIF